MFESCGKKKAAGAAEQHTMLALALLQGSLHAACSHIKIMPDPDHAAQ
jgi:hypothetical protein